MLPDFDLINADIDALKAKLADIDNVELINLEVEYLSKKSDADAAQSDVDFAIQTYVATPTKENLDNVNDKIKTLGEKVIEEQKAKVPYDAVLARKLGIQKRITRLTDAITDPIPIEAWCTDLSDGLESRPAYDPDDIAGSIELIGEDANGITLQPHYALEGIYDSDRDGVSMPAATFTPASYFYNRAMLPPWQKWQAVYRPGTIVAVSATPGGGWNVLLDDVKSFEQFPKIPVNDLDGFILKDVHAQYMNCDDAAFTVEDHVIVKTEYAAPVDKNDIDRERVDTIVGFVDNPKPCSLTGFNYHPREINLPIGTIHDWQNINRVLSPAGWVMTTPILTDVVSDTPSLTSSVSDWKGVLNSGENILVQWFSSNGTVVYVDSVRTATIPNFALTAAAGDPQGNKTPTEVVSAWVTNDKKYIYLIPLTANKSRNVVRKTITPEFTGNEYDPTTDPDGWEHITGFGPADYTDFNSYGRVFINESTSQGRAMDSWVHGAKRTPQVDPGSGATWRVPLTAYNDNWGEESQLNIASPSASNLSAAGVTHQFNGLLGSVFQEIVTTSVQQRFGLLNCTGFPIDDTYSNGSRVDTETETWSGENLVAVGFQGDTLGYLKIKASGSYDKTNTYLNTHVCPVGTVSYTLATVVNGGDFGRVYESDFELWQYPADVETINKETANFSSGATTKCGGTYSQELDTVSNQGAFEIFDVGDSIYRYRSEQFIHQEQRGWSGSVAGAAPNSCVGVINTIDENREEASILLGDTSIFRDRRENINQTIQDPVDITDIDLTLWPVITGPYGADPDVFVNTSNTDKFNMTAAVIQFGLASKWSENQNAKNHDGDYISWFRHTFNDAEDVVYESFLTGGDLATLDEIPTPADGMEYWTPHVVNIKG